MSKSTIIKNIRIGYADKESIIGDIFIENGTIIDVAFSVTKKADIQFNAIDQNWIAVPGFIDLHIHGSSGFDVMDGTEDALNGLASALPQEGTTSFLATTMTQSEEAIVQALQNISLFNASGTQAEMLGVHLEGPFISPKRAGAQPVNYIISPSIALFQKWQKHSGNRIKLVTVASEMENGLEFIEAITADGVVASIGHTDASAEQISDAIQVGATHVTHLYNQMRPFHHREPGAVGAALLEDKLTAELIVDFIHSHPQSVELAFRLKGADRIILVTDAMRAKGLAMGSYDLGGQEVYVSQQDARLPDGTLAGSILTMENAAKNMKAITKCTLADLVKMTSTNATEQLGLTNKGSIQPGKDADIVIIDEDWNVQMTFCRGILAYTKEEVKCK